ncbi:MAG: hypothetical protein ACLQVY_12555 [Limisphaerales bacterium]
MKLNILIATMALAATAFGQSEQWLTYHTSSEERGYHTLQLTTTAPAGVTLPQLNSPAWFARWQTPMDPAGGRWLCLDRSRKSGPCDRLFIDSSGNGRLDDKQPVMARLEFNASYFPAMPLVFKGEDGPLTYHVAFRFYQYESNPAQLLVSSAGWYEGMVDFDGVKKNLKLFDGNVNGTFNDIAANPFESDRVVIGGDEASERYLGRMLEVDGKFFNIEIPRDGAFVKVKKAENVPLGSVRVPENIAEFAAFGTNGYFVRKPAHGQLTLPAGQYRIVSWRIDRKDERGAAWTLSGYDFPDSARFAVAADKPADVKIGEPVNAVLEAQNSRSRDITFNLRFSGQQQESIQMLRGGERPNGPKLMLADAKGSLHSTNTFEFG